MAKEKKSVAVTIELPEAIESKVAELAKLERFQGMGREEIVSSLLAAGLGATTADKENDTQSQMEEIHYWLKNLTAAVGLVVSSMVDDYNTVPGTGDESYPCVAEFCADRTKNVHIPALNLCMDSLEAILDAINGVLEGD